jgi:hypothetical protein
VFSGCTTPKAIYPDLGQHFDNTVTKNYLMEQGVTYVLGPSGASKSFGRVEKSNRLLEC